MKKIILLSLIFLNSLLAEELSIIPQVQNLKINGQRFPLDSKISINFHDNIFKNTARHLQKWLKKEGFVIAPKEQSTYQINFSLDSELKDNYSLKIDKKQTSISSKSPEGAFYAFQTLKQILEKREKTQTLVPLEIIDKPRFQWRGMHLDVSRHFFPKSFIKKYIDHLARYKMNTFHWHLVDGPGWRIEIKKYPKLTSIGAWRKDKRATVWNWRATEISKKGKSVDSYGGFYTQDDIREIVAYATERYITIVPEIEMPGHSYASLIAYPEFACPTNNIKVDGLRGKDAVCVGNEKTYEFLENILDEVLELFPSKNIHIGADEVYKITWKECPLCEAKKKKEAEEKKRECVPLLTPF